MENKERYESLNTVFNNIENTNILDAFNKLAFLYEEKETIYDILEYINTIFYAKSNQNIKYIDCIKAVEEAKKNLRANANYDMTIDKLVFNIYK